MGTGGQGSPWGPLVYTALFCYQMIQYLTRGFPFVCLFFVRLRVDLCPPNIEKLRGYLFFRQNNKKKYVLRFFEIFFLMFGLDWRALVKSRGPNNTKKT